MRYRCSPRRVLWFVGHLPTSSATAAAMRGGPEYRDWNRDTYLLAEAVDRLGAVWSAVLTPWSKRPPKAPAPTRRPGGDRAASGKPGPGVRVIGPNDPLPA